MQQAQPLKQTLCPPHVPLSKSCIYKNKLSLVSHFTQQMVVRGSTDNQKLGKS